MNGYCAKLASNLDATVGLLTLSDSRQYKNVFFFNFHNFDFTVPLNEPKSARDATQALEGISYRKNFQIPMVLWDSYIHSRPFP